MDLDQLEYLASRLGEEGLSAFLELPEGSSLYQGDYKSLEENLLAEPKAAYFFPLSTIPFHRAKHLQLACVNQRVDCCFYLQNKTDIKNLAFLDSTHSLYYNHDLVSVYMKEINPDVQLVKVDIADLSSYKLAIHFGKFWSDEDLQLLSPEEFVPFPNAGMIVGVCHKENLETRKKMTRYHNEETFDLSNIQRGIQLNWPHNDDLIYLSAYSRRDVQSNIHTTVAYLKNSRLEYVHLSQSTSFDMVEEILKKI